MNPRFSVYTADKTSPRGFAWLWFIRLVQIVVSFIVLALTAANIAGLSGSTVWNCSVPGKMAWNLACAILALISLVYLTFSSGTMKVFRILPWWIFIQLGLDALMFIFWIAAAGTSHFGCYDLCNACDAWGSIYLVTYDRLACSCDTLIYYHKRDTSANPNLGLSGGLQKRRSRSASSASSSGLLVAREALDAIMVVLFFVTLCSTAWWMWQNRRAGDTVAPAASSNNPENGVQQVPMEMKHDTQYNNGTPQYTNGAPQQGNYGPVSPVNGTQGQYPPQQQGYPQQQPQQGYPQQNYPQQQQPYPQQQGYPPQQHPEQQPSTGYYGGPDGQQREMTPQHQQHDISNYPTPTPEMQAEHKLGQ